MGTEFLLHGVVSRYWHRISRLPMWRYDADRANIMKREINLQESSRAEAFHMWMSSPMPMVTLVKTLDVSRLLKICKKSGLKFNVLMCWCIGKAASQVEEFYTLPVDGKLYR